MKSPDDHALLPLAGMRVLVFGLASLSFVCLLGQLYGLWPMRLFACWILLPATAALAWIAFTQRHENPARWIVEGSLGGLIAAVAYDLFRLPFVLQGAPLFKVFPRFGELLLGATEPRWIVQTLGWLYHFSNGAALGIMFLAMATVSRRVPLVSSAMLWAMWVEAMLLLTPYAAFFGLKVNPQFVCLTVSAHLVFGWALGLWCRHRFAFRGLES